MSFCLFRLQTELRETHSAQIGELRSKMSWLKKNLGSTYSRSELV